MTIAGVDLKSARAMVEKRRELGFFRSVDDLGVTAPLLDSLRTMQQLMGQAALYHRA
jgi:hypothetical protein